MSGMFLVPLTAALGPAHPGWAFPLLITAVLAVSALHPPSGVLALALTTPFSAAIAQSFHVAPPLGSVADAAVLAFVSGGSLRLMWPRPDERSRVAGPALVLIAAIAASTIVELHSLQAITPRQPILIDLWRHLTGDYWLPTREFVVVHHAIRWISWLIAAVYVERVIRRNPSLAAGAVRLWVIAGTAGAAFAVLQLVEILQRGQTSALETLVVVMRSVRFSVLHPDVNAAGSYFALFLVPAIIVGLRNRHVWMLLVNLPLLLLAFVIARSRAAVVAIVLVCCWAGIQNLARRGNTRAQRLLLRSGGIAAVLLTATVALGAMFYATTRSHTSPNVAIRIRAEIAEVGMKTLQRFPLFGVGLGDYIRMTRRAITIETPALYRYAPEGENAHNNYLQIAVELGIPACLVFLWLVLPIGLAGIGNIAVPPSPEVQGMGLGLLAFLATAVLGHPLLIPEVGLAFFVAMGLCAGLMPAVERARSNRSVVRVSIAFYALSVIWRIA